MKTSRLFLAAGWLAAALCLRAETDDAGFKPLFNGKDLTGWDGDPALWTVLDGTITGRTTARHPVAQNTFLIWTNGAPGDFELRFSWKLTPGDAKGFANSGAQYRSKVLDPKTWAVGGYQADLEAGTNYSGILYEEKMSRGIMALRGEKVLWTRAGKKETTERIGRPEDIQAAIKQGDWNDYAVIARGYRLQHFINGKQTVDVTDETEGKNTAKGVIALQLHAGPPMTAQFKNIRLKEFKPDASRP